MAKLQFSSTDTEFWAEGYGDGGDGDLTVGSTTTFNPTRTNGSVVLATDSKVINVNSESGFSQGDIILVLQIRSSTSSEQGVWQLNVVESTAAGELTCKYDFVQDFDDSGDNICAVIKVDQHKDININATLNTTDFEAGGEDNDGIIVLMANNKITGTGQISVIGDGFTGAVQDAGGNPGYALGGESYNDNTQPSGPNRNEGGGGGGQRAPQGGGGGGGGAYAGNGQAGTTDDSAASNPAQGGLAYGDANLVEIYFGSGGGAGGGDQDNPAVFTGAPGGDGGGIVILIAPEIDLTNLDVDAYGANGTSRPTSGDNGGGGGGGAGGSVLLKGDRITLGTNKIDITGGSGGVGTGEGGDAGRGRCAVHYGTSVTGTVNSTYTGVNDIRLIPEEGGMFLTI